MRADVYDRPAINEVYPGFADLIRSSIRDAAPRPSESPAYQDLSLAIQDAIHPATGIDPKNPTPTYDKLKDKRAAAPSTARGCCEHDGRHGRRRQRRARSPTRRAPSASSG